ncbi:Do family serine endopeptidase [Nitratireductor thuwali]|uniref:Probable periplasmic serine endoprotease DegP-like n=1 Tax=Nitratireductor thuwali TaxID=2267699 RepID=A0ABY5MMB7_9HYPH|nr:Periplasmic pH-dependent serine endoprotease DegQ [Nitratireductor thuwali]
MSANNSTISKTRKRLVATAASVAIAGAVGLGAVTTGAVPVLAEPVKLDAPVQAPSFADVVELVSPAVVSVRVNGSVQEASGPAAPFFDMPGFEDLPDDHPMKRFFDQFREPPRGERRDRGPRPPRPVSQGSGFFISEDGYLVTNNHVIQGGDQYTVVMDDGTEIDAALVGTDPRTDLAVLKVEEKRKFTYVDFADDDRVRVGDWVVAVGNPFGLGGTVTAGIVSARGREISANPYDDYIQIDAAVNRGNSGGPAFNLSGEVIGVNTAIFSPSGGNVGIAFAIPASLAKSVTQQLIEKGEIERGWLGVEIRPVTAEFAESLGLDEEKGAFIQGTQEGQPAAKAGIRAGDVILAVKGESIDSPRELARKVAELPPGEKVEVSVWRNGKAITLEVELGEMPTDQQVASAPSEEPAPEADAAAAGFGLTVTPSEDGVGLVVTDVEPGSVADENGIQPGDVLRSVNTQDVSSVEDLKAAVEAAEQAGRQAILLQVVRDSANRFVTLPVG